MGVGGEVPDIFLVRRTTGQGRRVPLCFQEPSLFLLFLSLYFFPLPPHLILSLFFPFSSDVMASKPRVLYLTSVEPSLHFQDGLQKVSVSLEILYFISLFLLATLEFLTNTFS